MAYITGFTVNLLWVLEFSFSTLLYEKYIHPALTPSQLLLSGPIGSQILILYISILMNYCSLALSCLYDEYIHLYDVHTSPANSQLLPSHTITLSIQLISQHSTLIFKWNPPWPGCLPGVQFSHCWWFPSLFWWQTVWSTDAWGCPLWWQEETCKKIVHLLSLCFLHMIYKTQAGGIINVKLKTVQNIWIVILVYIWYQIVYVYFGPVVWCFFQSQYGWNIKSTVFIFTLLTGKPCIFGTRYCSWDLPKEKRIPV